MKFSAKIAWSCYARYVVVVFYLTLQKLISQISAISKFAKYTPLENNPLYSKIIWLYPIIILLLLYSNNLYQEEAHKRCVIVLKTWEKFWKRLLLVCMHIHYTYIHVYSHTCTFEWHCCVYSHSVYIHFFQEIQYSWLYLCAYTHIIIHVYTLRMHIHVHTYCTYIHFIAFVLLFSLFIFVQHRFNLHCCILSNLN